MPEIKGFNSQDINRAALPILGLPADTDNETIMGDLIGQLNSPLRVYAAATPDSKLYIEPNKIVQPDGGEIATPPQSGLIPTFVASWIDFQAQTTGGGSFTLTFPASTVGQFRRMGLSLISDGTMECLFSDEVAVEGNLADPGILFIRGAIPSGWIDLECTDVAGKFKTIGSATDIIENEAGAAARIHRFGSGGGGGSGSVETLALLTGATARENNTDNDLIYVVETETFYRYEATALSAVDADDLYIIDVTEDANARFVGVSGKYIYESLYFHNYMQKVTTIASASSGTWNTGHPGKPTIAARFWDDSESKFYMLSVPSWGITADSGGSGIDYDFTTQTFDTNDYVELIAIYHDLVATQSNEFDSDWITVSDVNNLKESGAETGWHEVTLPTGFSLPPAGYTLVRDNGVSIFAEDVAHAIIFSTDSGYIKVAVDASTWDSADKFILRCSMSARPSGKADDYLITVGEDLDYATLPLAVAAVSANKKIVVTNDTVITSQLDLTKAFPYEIEFLQGSKVTSATALATSAIKLGDDLSVRNLILECTHTSGTTPSGIQYAGSNVYLDNAQVKQSGAGGTITDAYVIDSGEKANFGACLAYQAAGTITNGVTDNSGNGSNIVTARERT